MANWFQMESNAHFLKLYGKIEKDLKKGEKYTIVVSNMWKGYDWGATKKIFISEVNFFGGRDVQKPFFGIFFLVAGIFTSIAGALYAALYFLVVKKRQANRFK